MCVYLYIHKYSQYTHIYIMLTKAFILAAINHLTALDMYDIIAVLELLLIIITTVFINY